MELTVKVKRDMEKCNDCKHNPKNMTLIKRIKNLFESFPTMCELCTGEEVIKRLNK